MTTIRTAEPIESPMQRAFRQGHRGRTGHELVVIMASADGILWHRIALCCGETVEGALAAGRLTTWAQAAPPVPALAHHASQE